jgi:hypothetical protein
MRYISLAALLLLGTVQASKTVTIGSTLAECKAIASKFKNTCSEAPDSSASWSDFDSETISCTQSTCPDSTTAGSPTQSCSWSRKLCVSCYESGSDVYIQVQTNGLPDHCYSTPNTVYSWTFDFTVKYNVDISSESASSTFSSQSTFDTAVCTVSKDSSVPSWADYALSSDSDSMTTAFGVALNGVVILASSSTNNIDPFYPNSWSGMVELADEYVDGCLGHPNGPGVYHYHILSPCIIDSSSVSATSSCTSIDACSSDVASYTLDFYADYNYETVLGIGRDGHLLLGPYDHSGDQFDCTEFDQCGGTYSNDGSYVYIFNNVYPYVNNCWGPGEDLVYEASCTTNTCSDYDSNSVFISAFSAFMVLAASFALLF